MPHNNPVRLTVSDVRQRIFEAAGTPAKGAGSLAGQLFHRVAECALREGHPAGWRSALAADLNAADWAAALYDRVLGPELARLHGLLNDSGEDVLTLWRGVESFTRWFCGLLQELSKNGLVRYNGRTEEWIGGDSLFKTECELEVEFSQPEWTQAVLVSGRLDQVIRVAPNRCCVIELKLGGGHAEADAAQACLYHDLLGGDADSAAMVRFGGQAEAEETLLGGEWIQQARPSLLALIATLAGVIPASPTTGLRCWGGHGQHEAEQAGEIVKTVEMPHPQWPRKPSQAELDIGHKLVRAMAEFGAEVRPIGEPLVGPAFVRYLLEPGRGVPAGKIEKQGANLQLRLQLGEEPMIGRADGRIAVDVRRLDREFVSFASVRTAVEAKRSDSGNANVIAGVDLRGEIHFIDLARPACPHLLVGGMTGSGKSEWLRVAIASLLVTNNSETLRLVLIDPKQTGFSDLAGSPFLWRPDALVRDIADGSALHLVEDLIEEMERRYGLFRQAAADDLETYRRKTGESLPRIVCVVDEFADLLQTGGRRQRDEYEAGFCRIAQKGRAAGIHLILATQHPSRAVVSGILKANLPGKIALKVSTRIASSVLLDQGGAQNLLGYGDLLFSAGGDPVRLQSPWLGEGVRFLDAFDHAQLTKSFETQC